MWIIVAVSLDVAKNGESLEKISMCLSLKASAASLRLSIMRHMAPYESIWRHLDLYGAIWGLDILFFSKTIFFFNFIYQTDV